MKSKFFLSRDRAEGETKQEALQQLALFLSEKMKAESKAIYDSLLERENAANTGLEKGIAVPHAFLPEAEEAHLCVMVFDQAIKDWYCLDDSPVRILICLVLPQSYSVQTPNVKELTKIFQLLADDGLTDAIQAAENSEDIITLLMENLKKGGK